MNKFTQGKWKRGGQKILIDPRTATNVMTQVIETELGEIEVLDFTNEPDYNLQLMVASPKMLHALEETMKLIKLARYYFPKSIQNEHTFTLENCCATVGKAIYEATGEQS